MTALESWSVLTLRPKRADITSLFQCAPVALEICTPEKGKESQA